MNLITLNTNALSAYAGATLRCRCGGTHTVQTQQIRVGSGTVRQLGEAVVQIVPIGSAALLLCTSTLMDRFGAEAERFLRRAGFLIKRSLLDEDAFELLNTDKLDALSVDEDIRLILGVGGGSVADAAKYVGARHGLPVFLAATSPATAGYLTASAEGMTDGMPVRHAVPPPVGLLCDFDWVSQADDALIASGFGELLSRMTAVLDWRVSAVLTGEPCCKQLCEQAYWGADTALKALKGVNKGDKRLPALLAELNLRLSALTQTAQNGRLYGGGDESLLRCLKLLFRHEQRALKHDGENRFILSAIASKVYRQMLQSDSIGFCAPPNNNVRIEKITELFGVAPSLAAARVLPFEDADTLRLRAYRLGEYRAELCDLATETDLMLDEAYGCFKRLYRDDGYSLTQYLDESDVAVCLALAPDLGDGFTLLSHMKSLGVLERYL